MIFEGIASALEIYKQEEEIPPEYRRYIKPEDLAYLPSDVKVYRGPRGGLYVDVRELKSRGWREESIEDFGMSWLEIEEYRSKVSKILEDMSKRYGINIEWIGSRLPGRDVDLMIDRALDDPWKIAREIREKVGVKRVDIFMPMTEEAYNEFRDSGDVQILAYDPEELYQLYTEATWGFGWNWIPKKTFEEVVKLKEELNSLKIMYYDCVRRVADRREELMEQGLDFDEANRRAEEEICPRMNEIRERIEEVKDRLKELGIEKGWANGIVESIAKVLEMCKYEWFTTIVDDEDFELLKAGFHKALKRYPKSEIFAGLLDVKFWEKYAGLTKEQSRRINDILMKVALERRWHDKDYVIRAIASVGIPYDRAELIAKTELANLANKVREFAYRNWTKVQKFKWVTERDSKVCEKCKEMERRTAHGVTLDELKELIKEIGGETAREFVLHPACRCTFTRYWSGGQIRVRWWE